MKRRVAILLLILAPVLMGAVGVAAGNLTLPVENSTNELAFNNPRGAMPRALDYEPAPPVEVATSENVEHIGFVPFEEGGGRPATEVLPSAPEEVLTATGASIQGDYMYLTSWKNISVYDISDPEDPQLTDIEPIGFQFENEDVATDGDILLFSEQLPGDILHVWDVSDKNDIKEIATLDNAGDHTMTCILDCEWAYGSDGAIVDLRDPENPKLMEEDWHEITGLNSDGAHDVNEYKNGFLVTSPISDDFQILDVREPLNPKVRGTGAHPQPEDFLFHSGTWPNGGKDNFVIMQGEKNFKPQCDDGQGPVMTFDATKKKGSKEFKFEQADTYRVDNGIYADGAPAVNALGCSAHWFEVHPTFKDGGLMTLGYYEHGTHFLDVGKKGKIRNVGYFLPVGGSTSASYWVTDNLVYAIDYTRGIDILRYTGPGTDGKGKGANQRGNGRG
ncbi:MAG: LVIVD repeat-containing protein [Rubrobacteraceae bacterium]